MKKNKPNIAISNKIYSKAKKIIPAGSQTFSKGVTQFVEGFAPKYLHRGKGAYVWDVDKNKYLDYVDKKVTEGHDLGRMLKHLFGLSRGDKNAKTFRIKILETIKNNSLDKNRKELEDLLVY